MMAFTLVVCLQESVARKGCLSLQTGATELSLVRSSDDWPVLEPFSILCDARSSMDLELSIQITKADLIVACIGNGDNVKKSKV